LRTCRSGFPIATIFTKFLYFEGFDYKILLGSLDFLS